MWQVALTAANCPLDDSQEAYSNFIFVRVWGLLRRWEFRSGEGIPNPMLPFIPGISSSWSPCHAQCDFKCLAPGKDSIFFRFGNNEVCFYYSVQNQSPRAGGLRCERLIGLSVSRRTKGHWESAFCIIKPLLLHFLSLKVSKFGFDIFIYFLFLFSRWFLSIFPYM